MHKNLYILLIDSFSLPLVSTEDPYPGIADMNSFNDPNLRIELNYDCKSLIAKLPSLSFLARSGWDFKSITS